LRELNIYTLIGDMYAGRPSAYATFVGYDEVAHHSGVESKDAYDALFKIDQQFARLENASAEASRPYHFVILSDHGQSGGLTFLQRYGKSLEDLVQELAEEHLVQGFVEAGEGMGHVNALLTDAIQNQSGAAARGLSRALRSRTEDGQVNIGPEAENLELEEVDPDGDGKDAKGDELPAIVVMASGNLGLVYGTLRPGRATHEGIETVFPGLLEGLVAHEGVGFIMVASEQGPLVIGKKGRYYLAEDRIEGENPLADFGPRAAEHLRREDSFSNCPDILVNSFYNAETNEVAAYEELIGCHGGLGGYQTQPFLLYPAEWQLAEEEIVGAENVYKQLKGWLGQYEQAGASE
jgi:hypothetical protein